MKVLFIQHDFLSPVGPVGERFTDRGIDVVTHLVVPEADFESPNVATSFPDVGEFDYVVPMGAPWSVYDEASVGLWIKPETELVREADQLGIPVLGICFGGQLLAQAHGGTVTKSPFPEIGWTNLTSDEPALEGPWFEWHYDRWTMPADAHEVARNSAASQAWTLRRNLAVQFHPELDSQALDGWLRFGGVAEAIAHGKDPDKLVAQTLTHEPDARLRAHKLVDYFIDQVATK